MIVPSMVLARVHALANSSVGRGLWLEVHDSKLLFSE
jgi:hypothetical protein